MEKLTLEWSRYYQRWEINYDGKEIVILKCSREAAERIFAGLKREDISWMEKETSSL